MDIRVQVTSDPNRTLRGLRQLRRRRLWIMRLYGVAMVLLGLVMVATSAIGAAVFLVLVGAALVLLPDVSLAQAVRRNARLTTGPTTIELTDERLRSSNSMASTDVAWSAVNRATENDEFWFLRLVTKQAIILPKQHFTQEQQDVLRAFLANRGLVAAKQASVR